MDLVRLLGRNVREARQRKRMTQEALALEADMKRSYLSELEAGKRNPSVRALGRLAVALEIEAGELLREPGASKNSASSEV
jgi:transcriptional regulator with XRE-family HTH domain